MRTVCNPQSRSPAQPGLAKAIQVARALGASLELFHALTDAVFIELADPTTTAWTGCASASRAKREFRSRGCAGWRANTA